MSIINNFKRISVKFLILIKAISRHDNSLVVSDPRLRQIIFNVNNLWNEKIKFFITEVIVNCFYSENFDSLVILTKDYFDFFDKFTQTSLPHVWSNLVHIHRLILKKTSSFNLRLFYETTLIICRKSQRSYFKPKLQDYLTELILEFISYLNNNKDTLNPRDFIDIYFELVVKQKDSNLIRTIFKEFASLYHCGDLFSICNLILQKKKPSLKVQCFLIAYGLSTDLEYFKNLTLSGFRISQNYHSLFQRNIKQTQQRQDQFFMRNLSQQSLSKFTLSQGSSNLTLKSQYQTLVNISLN